MDHISQIRTLANLLPMHLNILACHNFHIFISANGLPVIASPNLGKKRVQLLDSAPYHVLKRF